MDINKQIQDSVNDFIETKLTAVIDEKVQSMFTKVVDDIFCSYGDSAKQIKQAIQKKLDLNLDSVDLVEYNVIICNAISKRLKQIVDEKSVKPILALIDGAVGYVENKKMTLTDVYDRIVEKLKEYYDNDQEGDFTFLVEHDEKYDWYRIGFDDNKNVSLKNCGIEFLISGKGGHIFSFKAGNYACKKEELTPFRIANLSNIESEIFKLYAANVTIEVDETDFEQNWNRYYDND